MAIFSSRSWIILIISAFTFVACRETPKAKNEVIDGKSLYKNNCKVCHGPTGSLGVGGAADLSKSQKTFEEKVYMITNGSESGKMTAFKGVLIEKEIDAVAKYIETLKK